MEYTNDIRSISAIDNFISINNAVDIDLFGQVNAESAGIKHISGAGGQLDFVLGAYLSNGGKSFICLSSTFMNKKTGKVESRIRPTLENGSIVTDTRANIHYLCTEYGCVNLKGLTSWEKAEALISVAHPDFRDELIAEAEKLAQIDTIVSSIQPGQTRGLLLCLTVLPFVLMYASYELYKKHYILDEDKYAEVCAELEKRRAEAK